MFANAKWNLGQTVYIRNNCKHHNTSCSYKYWLYNMILWQDKNSNLHTEKYVTKPQYHYANTGTIIIKVVLEIP